MQVQHILKEKADDGVVTVPLGTKVSAVAEILSTRKIGAVIVSQDGKHVEGIVSERDIVRELGRRGPSSLDDTVDDIMTRNLVTCSRGETALEVLGRMSHGRFRHMPVMEGDEMIGLISIGDAVQARLRELAMEKEALTGMIMGN